MRARSKVHNSFHDLSPWNVCSFQTERLYFTDRLRVQQLYRHCLEIALPRPKS